MTDNDQSNPSSASSSLWAYWTVTAAFGTYFCMYGFRKPFTAGTFADPFVFGHDFKTVIVSTQVFGYMLSKFIGIKVISETPPHRRATAILVLIVMAELALVLFGVIPRPYNAFALFLNGLSLGMVFGLVLGFLEGRQVTEALTAGLCTSFILADGVTKTVGSWLLTLGVPEDWMPAVAGALYFIPLCICVVMLGRTPPPTEEDIVSRSARSVMNRRERWSLFARYATGLSLVVAVYLLVTIMRSVRSDFATELWRSLGEPAKPQAFTNSEICVALGVLVTTGMVIWIRDNAVAFRISLATCLVGLITIPLTIIAHRFGHLNAFAFMVLVGLGLYLPYVAVHTTVFERLLAMTRERGNLGFLMYVADAVGYLGYVAVMITRKQWSVEGNFLHFFVWLCLTSSIVSLILLALSWYYFSVRIRPASAVLASDHTS